MTKDFRPTSAEAPVVFLALSLTKRVRAIVTERFAPLGLHPGQDRLLSALWDEDGLAQSDLIRRLAVEPPTVTNTVTRLERAGFVRRERDPNNRRISRVFLTEAGRALERPVRTILQDAEDLVLAPLTPRQRRELEQLLHRVSRSPS